MAVSQTTINAHLCEVKGGAMAARCHLGWRPLLLLLVLLQLLPVVFLCSGCS